MDEHLQNDIDNLFRDSLQFHKDDPPEDVWKKIEKQLDKDDRLLFKTIVHRRLWIAAGLLAILAGGEIVTLNRYNTGQSLTLHSLQINDNGASLPRKNSAENNEPPVSGLTVNNNTNGNYNQTLKAGPASSGGKVKGSLRYNNLSLNNSINNNYDIIWNPGNPSGVSFRDSNDAAIIDSAISVLPHVCVQSPEFDRKSFNVEKEALLAERKIPDNMIVKHQKQNFNNRFSITPYFSQEFAGYNLSDDDATAADGKEIEKKERNVFSASLGFYLNYELNKRWVIQSGISYSWSSSIIDSSKSFAVKNNSGIVQFRMNTISGYGYLQTPNSVPAIVGDSVLTAKAYSQLHYLSIPLVLSYKFPMKRFSLLAGAGVTLNILTGATVETKIYGPNFRQDESAIDIKGLKKVNYGILLKAELEYRISSKLGINIIPTFKNALSPINIHSALSAYPYNFGIGLGINYRL